MWLENGAEKVQEIPSKEIWETLAKVDMPNNTFGKSAEKMTGPTLADIKKESDSLKPAELIPFISKLGGFARQKNKTSVIAES